MELNNCKILETLNHQITITGEWIKNKKSRWEGFAISDVPMVSISFLEITNKNTTWLKSERSNSNQHEIHINLYNYDSTGLDIQFSYYFNKSIDYYRSEINSVDYLPNIFTGNLEAGTIILFSRLEGKPLLNLYILFIPMNMVKTGRNGIWHLKDKFILQLNQSFIGILQNGRKGRLLI